MNQRLALPARHHHITQKVCLGGQRTLSLSVHDDAHPAEVFLRVKGPNCSSELIGLNNVLAQLTCIAMPNGAHAEKIDSLLKEAQFVPCGPMSE